MESCSRGGRGDRLSFQVMLADGVSTCPYDISRGGCIIHEPIFTL